MKIPGVGLSWLKRLKIESLTDLYLCYVAFVLPWQGHKIVRKGITFFHVSNSLLVCGILIALLVRGPRPKWYLAIPMYVYLVGSVLGMFASEAYTMNLYTLSQDLYLYVWFVILCVFLDSNRRVELLVVAWVLASVLVLSTEGFLAEGGGTARVEFSFRNPNRAAAYLTLSFFLLLHPVIPWLVKGVLCALIAVGVAGTGSAAGSLGLYLGAFTFLWCLVYARVPRTARPLLFLGVAILGLTVLAINPTKSSSLPSLLGGVATSAAPRIERSADTREQIWSKGMETFREHPLGIGPASFHKMIDSGVSDDGAIELHSDPVAAIVERGIVGFIGYLMLIAWMAREIFSMLHRSKERREVLWAAALAGASVSYLFYSITHEALHHETFWLMLALIISQVRILGNKERPVDAPAVLYPRRAFGGAMSRTGYST